MKKVIIGLLGAIVLLIGMSLVCYPFISNYLMEQNQAGEILTQKLSAENADSEVVESALKSAREYNESLLGSVMLSDPFDPGFKETYDKDYSELLDLDGSGVMGSIEIPKIDVNLPIYHGTSTKTLEKGAGHLQKTSLPIGGKNTHAVITGHSGLSTARLFTDLEQLSEGDIFFIYVLNQKLAYKVDNIEVVLPTETEDLRVVPEKDYVTLLTCTPYGKNTHRLLVRGERTDYEEAKEIAANTQPVETTWLQQYKKALLIGAAVLLVTVFVFFIVKVIVKAIQNKKAKGNT